MGQDLTSRDRTLLIQEMSRRQDAEITRLRSNVEAFRSIFGRLQEFATTGWFDINGDHWLSKEAVLGILEAVEGIVKDATKSNDVPFGINRLGDVPTVHIIDKGTISPSGNYHPLDQ